MSNFKIIENRSKKILKYQDHIFKFNNAVNTRVQGTLWSCATERCKAFVKVNSDNTKILESNEKHEHTTSKNIGKKNSIDIISSPRTSTSSSEADAGELIISPKSTTSKQDQSNIVPVKENELKENQTNRNSGVLPFNQSILSVATPGLNATIRHIDSTFDETPRVRDEVGELKRQVDGLIQEIINKQIEIDRLKAKSEADDNDMKDMIRTIRMLEGVKNIESTGNKTQDTDSKATKSKRNKQFNQQTVQSENHKIQDLERNKTINTQNTQVTRIGIFGDSHVRNLREQLQRELPNNYQVHAHFKPGGTFHEISNMFTQEDSDYDLIFVIAGTNDVCHSSWTEVENAVYQISSTLKNKKVYLILPPPRGEETVVNHYIKTFNRSIKELTSTLDNINLVDISYVLDYQHYAYDRLHLNRLGKIKLCKKISQIICKRESKVFKTYTSNKKQQRKTNNVFYPEKTNFSKPREFNDHQYHYYHEYKPKFYPRTFYRTGNVNNTNSKVNTNRISQNDKYHSKHVTWSRTQLQDQSLDIDRTFSRTNRTLEDHTGGRPFNKNNFLYN